jgi:hypothetical protein
VIIRISHPSYPKKILSGILHTFSLKFSEGSLYFCLKLYFPSPILKKKAIHSVVELDSGLKIAFPLSWKMREGTHSIGFQYNCPWRLRHPRTMKMVFRFGLGSPFGLGSRG